MVPERTPQRVEGLRAWPTCARLHLPDQLQPQTPATWRPGCGAPAAHMNMAAQIIEVAPGLDIESLTNVALKYADVGGGILVVERQFGYLGFTPVRPLR